MDELRHLQEQRRLLWRSVRSSHSLLRRAQKLCSALEKRYEKDEKVYEECDRKLAMLDGRYERVLVEKERHKALTESQILEIAKKLGIELEV